MNMTGTSSIAQKNPSSRRAAVAVLGDELFGRESPRVAKPVQRFGGADVGRGGGQVGT